VGSWRSPLATDETMREFGCVLSRDWKLDSAFALALAKTIIEFDEETRTPVSVISGHRTDDKQRQLKKQGRPAAPVHLSNHTRCPATAVDLRISGIPTNVQKAILGRIATLNGLRWGGGSPVDPCTGIPSDWNHLDTGPRVGNVWYPPQDNTTCHKRS